MPATCSMLQMLATADCRADACLSYINLVLMKFDKKKCTYLLQK